MVTRVSVLIGTGDVVAGIGLPLNRVGCEVIDQIGNRALRSVGEGG
jgi:hypothetical protein